MMASEAAAVLIPMFIMIVWYGFLRKRIYPEDYDGRS